ncbi:MAG: hypothetical protein ACLQBD_08505 [Syntrophobacteraceae bacterium]
MAIRLLRHPCRTPGNLVLAFSGPTAIPAVGGLVPQSKRVAWDSGSRYNSIGPAEKATQHTHAASSHRRSSKIFIGEIIRVLSVFAVYSELSRMDIRYT